MLAAALAPAPAAAAAAVAMLVCNLAAFSFFLELQIAMWTPLIGTAFVVSSSAACRPCRPAVATVPQTSRGSLGFVGQFPAPRWPIPCSPKHAGLSDGLHIVPYVLQVCG